MLAAVVVAVAASALILIVLLHRAGTHEADAFKQAQVSMPAGPQPPEILSIVNKELGVNDRCISCHQFTATSTLPALGTRKVSAGEGGAGTTNKTEGGKEAPAWRWTGEHPGGWLKWHPPEVFGCTPCHGGNGLGATYIRAAHAAPGADRQDGNWQDGKRMAAGSALYARCGACHAGDYVAGAEQLGRGRVLIRELNCAGCHEVGRNLAATRKGPSLAKVGQKLTLELLESWPNEVHEWDASSRMPQFNLGEDERLALAAYLANGLSPLDAKAGGLVGDGDAGLEIIRQARCANCHVLPKPAGADPADPLWAIPGGRIGPDLGRISERVQKAWLVEFLADTRGHYPDTRMPSYRLAGRERTDVATWLMETSAGMKPKEGEAAAAPPEVQVPEDREEELTAMGRKLFLYHGCVGCHAAWEELPAYGQAGAQSLLNIGEKQREQLPKEAQGLPGLFEYFIKKLDDPGFVSEARMPRFALTDAEREAIATALLAEVAPPPAPYITLLSPEPDEGYPQDGDFADRYWSWPPKPQGAGPETLSRFERDLHPQACATCHREEYTQWLGSRHARAMSPGVTGQLIEWIEGEPGKYYSCMRCHAGLAEQAHVRQTTDAEGKRAYEANPHFQPRMYETAHGCVNCHVRGHIRYSSDEPRTQHLWEKETLSAHELKRSSWLRQSAFCKDCHQFEASRTIAGGHPPLENTYEEWRAWAETAAEPKSCQECHMVDGGHGFSGIHDAAFVKANATVSTRFTQSNEAVEAAITLTNTNNGHFMPTYVTPKIYFRGYFADASGRQVPGTFKEAVMGRDVRRRTGADGRKEWYDKYDNRLAPDESFTFEYSQRVPPGAKTFHLDVFVAPDDFYHKAFAKWLEDSGRTREGLELLGQALRETAPSASGYYLLQEAYPILE